MQLVPRGQHFNFSVGLYDHVHRQVGDTFHRWVCFDHASWWEKRGVGERIRSPGLSPLRAEGKRPGVGRWTGSQVVHLPCIGRLWASSFYSLNFLSLICPMGVMKPTDQVVVSLRGAVFIVCNPMVGIQKGSMDGSFLFF